MKLTVIKTYEGKQVVTAEQKVRSIDEYVTAALKFGVEADFEQLVEEFTAGADRTYIVGL
jgi:hypothetical protein